MKNTDQILLNILGTVVSPLDNRLKKIYSSNKIDSSFLKTCLSEKKSIIF